MTRKLVLSTNNVNKIQEIKYLLEDLPIQVLSKKDIGQGGFEILEDGESLEANSQKKAMELSELTNYMVVADDSGLFVDALGGKPGVFSSRYAGEEGNDRKNNEKLLEEMKNFQYEDRKASFKAVVTLVTEDKQVINVHGQCRGHIGFSLQGPEVFGYDPLFIPEGYDKSFAELDMEIKNKISHRAKALEKLKKVIKGLLEDDNYENPSNQ